MKITSITRYTKDKDGNTLKTRDGRPYTSVRLKVEEHGDKWISGFGNAQNENWQVGDEVDITVAQKGEYLNFVMPKKSSPDMDRFATVLNNIQSQLGDILQILPKLVGKVDALDDVIRYKQEATLPLAGTQTIKSSGATCVSEDTPF